MSRRLPEGTVISTQDCPGCGAVLPVKENSAGGVYFFCAAPVWNAETGKAEKCMTRFNVGRAGSKRIIDDFLANKEEITNVQPEHDEEGKDGTAAADDAAGVTAGAGDGGRGADVAAGTGSGFAGAFRAFFTGA